MHLTEALAGQAQIELTMSKAALVDLDWSTAFMMVVFLLFWLILNKIFVQPMLTVLEKRHDLTDGARESADKAVKSAESKISEYESQVGEARRKGVAEQKQLRAEGLARERKELTEVRAEAEQKLAAGVVELQESAAAIEKDLEAQAQVLGQKILSRVVGGAA